MLFTQTVAYFLGGPLSLNYINNIFFSYVPCCATAWYHGKQLGNKVWPPLALLWLSSFGTPLASPFGTPLAIPLCEILDTPLYTYLRKTYGLTNKRQVNNCKLERGKPSLKTTRRRTKAELKKSHRKFGYSR